MISTIRKSVCLLTFIAVVLGLCCSASAQVLTFEGLKDSESVNNYYNGGTGGSGSGPGPNYGISFTTDSLALISASSGGAGNFSNNPSGSTVLFFLNGAGDTMNVASGFITGFSFFYACQAGFVGSVSVYSGLNGTGTLLASLSLPSTPNPYTVFVPIGVAFAGTAKSAVFSGSANFIAFDDITLGNVIPGTSAVPEGGATAFLLGVSLAGLVLFRAKSGKASLLA